MEHALTEQEQVEAPEPQAPDRPPVRAVHARGVGNATLAAWVARSPAPGRTLARTPDDREPMAEIERTMTTVKEASRARAAEFNRLNDEAITDLQAANTHLQSSNREYSAAWDRFTGKIREADEAFETEQMIKDLVQGIVIAAALAVIGPELLVVRGGQALCEAGAEATFRTLARAGAAGGLGEVVESGVGAGVDSSGEPVRPTSTMSQGNASAGDRYEEAFAKLGEMIQAMPKLGRAATAATNTVSLAGTVQTEAVRLGGGGTGQWTAAQVTERAGYASTANTENERAIPGARRAAASVRTMKDRITAEPIKTSEEVERLLWTNWMATLSGDQNEVLDNDTIQDYLTSMGLISPGSYMSDADQGEAVHNARRSVLRARGIDVDFPGLAVNSVYDREMKLDELRRRYLDQEVRVVARGRVQAGSRYLDVVGAALWFAPGTMVRIGEISVKQNRSRLDLCLAEWREDDYEFLTMPIVAQPEQAPVPADAGDPGAQPVPAAVPAGAGAQ